MGDKYTNTINYFVLHFELVNNPGVISNGSSSELEKNEKDVLLISGTPNPVNVMSTIGDI